MTEQNQNQGQKKGRALLGVVALAAGIATGGVGSAVISQPDTVIVADQIDAKEEMAIAMGTLVTNLQGVGMYDAKVGAHMHLTWTNSPQAKSYNIYVDGAKVASVQATDGERGRFMLAKNLRAGKAYTVTATVINQTGTESEQSEAVKVTIPR